MSNINSTSNPTKAHTSTILGLKLTDKARFGYLTVKSGLSVEQGQIVAYEFSKKNQGIKSIYQNGIFWIIRHPDDSSSQAKWQESLNQIAVEVKARVGVLNLTIKDLGKAENLSAEVISELAARILKRNAYKDSWQTIISARINIKIYRYLQISPETFSNKAGVILNWKTSAKYPGTLKDYWIKHQKNNNLLIGLDVENRFVPGSGGIIVGITGICKTENKRLLSYPDLHPSTRKIIEESDENDLVVSVKSSRFGEETYPDYVLNGLEITINQENAQILGIDYENYRQQTIIKLKEWKDLIIKAKQDVASELSDWGIKISSRYVNSEEYPDIFYKSNFELENVKLQFGRNVVFSRQEIKKGLMAGGVYRRHPDFADQSITLQVAVINLGKTQDDRFLSKLQAELNNLKFKVNFVRNKIIDVQGKMSEIDATAIEQEVKIIAALQPDLVITILPRGDKKLDNTERGSYYHHIYSQLLPRGIASQMIKEENINNSYIINNINLGILAKTGNLPFVLAEPLKVADYFIGLDVAHSRKARNGGTKNACACVRIYGNKGEFIKYKLDDSVIEGEEIPAKVLRKLLPFEDLNQKRVLIFRDGRFRGKEIEFLRERSKAIEAQFIFVEITKSGTCRLFDYYCQEDRKNITLNIPSQYLILEHSERTVTMTTTNPPPSIGLAQPIRITICDGDIIPSLDEVIEATLKLCLLHHGSYKEAGIPIPIFASDRIGYKTLKGLYHVQREGDRQWWL